MSTIKKASVHSCLCIRSSLLFGSILKADNNKRADKWYTCCWPKVWTEGNPFFKLINLIELWWIGPDSDPIQSSTPCTPWFGMCLRSTWAWALTHKLRFDQSCSKQLFTGFQESNIASIGISTANRFGQCSKAYLMSTCCWLTICHIHIADNEELASMINRFFSWQCLPDQQPGSSAMNVMPGEIWIHWFEDLLTPCWCNMTKAMASNK